MVVLGVFLASDADFYLMFAPYDPATSPFRGQIVWIVGASSGIGAALAQDLCLAGAQVILSARRENQLNEIAKSCSGAPPPVVLPLDVLDSQAREDAYASILSRFGRVDSVVLNAGRTQRAPLENTTDAMAREIMELNYHSMVDISRLALPNMLARRAGQFVVVSSVSGKFGVPLAGAYSASKFALVKFYTPNALTSILIIARLL